MLRVLMTTLAFAALFGTLPAQSSKVTVPFFGNTTCPYSGKPVKKDLFVEEDGQRVYVCCKKCLKMAKADPKAALVKAYPADKVKDVGNAKCPIMGEKVKPGKSVVVQGHRIGLCCPGCAKKVKKNPRRILTKLTMQGVTELGNEKCLVEKDDDVDPAVFVVYKKKIVGLCCDHCVEEFSKNPEKYMPKGKGSGQSSRD